MSNRISYKTLVDNHGTMINDLVDGGQTYQQVADTLTDMLRRPVSVHQVQRARNHMRLMSNMTPNPSVSSPAAPSLPPLEDLTPPTPGDEPIEDLIERRLKATNRTIANDTNQFVAKMPAKPWAVMVWGDPHLDDPGFAMGLFLEHINAIQRAPAGSVWSVNIGDTQNHWVGRLAYLHAKQDVTAKDGWRLARWFMGQGPNDCQLPHRVMVGGNHDSWSHHMAIDPYAYLCKHAGIPFYDANEVRVRVEHGDGVAPLSMIFRHDFPGRSQFHKTHGVSKAAAHDPEADLLVAGHLHAWGSLHQEHRGPTHLGGNRSPLSLRVRGYKVAGDDYAKRLGFYNNQHGHSVLVVIRPNVDGPARLNPFWDIGHGIDYLTWLRDQHDEANN